MGEVFIYVAFAAAFTASIFFFTAFKGKEKNIKFGRLFFHVAVIGTICSAAFLLYLILTHQFQYTYVWDYSSRDLPLNLLISTFYAGQEGSFHLWAFLMSVLGVFLITYLMRRDSKTDDKYEAPVMAVFTLLQSFLLFILIIKSPYKYVWESFPKDVQFGFMPQDGRGLNPLLQNFWMSIHPPILFTGFSSLSIPFCFAIAALLKNKYDRWFKLALPWTLFSGMVLGTGIMLGGFWAYGVLGWGGYWGWDPVENSSFVPWIAIVAGIHTMISQEKTGKFKRTSLLLCVAAYVLVLYSTFLTRSGILGDASVHSFVDPGQEVFIFLIIFMFLFKSAGYNFILRRFFNTSYAVIGSCIALNIAGLIIGVTQSINGLLFAFLLFGFDGLLLIYFGLTSFRKKEGEAKEETELLSRESALFVGAVTLCATALVILIGTSWPIITKGTVDASFYNKMNLPLAILIASINGFSILLKWKHSEEKKFLRSLIVPIGLTALVTIVLVAVGIREFLIGLFAAAAFFAFFINVEMAYRIFVRTKLKAGPYIAHMGVMLLFLGIISTAKYSQEENVSLPIDQPKDVLGYTMTYKGATPMPGDSTKYNFNVVVEKEGRAMLLQPVMFYSEYSQGVMKNPDIANLVIKDIYLSPMSLEEPQDYTNDDVIELAKGDTKDTKGLKVKFVDFDRSKFNRDKLQSGEDNIMGAALEVTMPDGKIQNVTAQQKISQGNNEEIPVQIDGNDKYTFYLTNISVKDESKVSIAIVDNTLPKAPQPSQTLVLTASIKPFINLVWGGTIVMVLGFFTSLLNRYRLNKLEQKRLQPILHTNGVSKNGSHKKANVSV